MVGSHKVSGVLRHTHMPLVVVQRWQGHIVCSCMHVVRRGVPWEVVGGACEHVAGMHQRRRATRHVHGE